MELEVFYYFLIYFLVTKLKWYLHRIEGIERLKEHKLESRVLAWSVFQFSHLFRGKHDA